MKIGENSKEKIVYASLFPSGFNDSTWTVLTEGL